MSVDVLMPAYNYGHYVGRAVQSVLDQDYPPDRLRLIVVDDGSSDDTATVVQALADAHPGRITLISQANAGPSAAINRALAEADAELLAVLDADDVWLPEKTRRQAELLRSDPALTMVFCDMRVVDGEERTVRPSQVGNIGAFPRRAFGRLLCQNAATQSSIMLRRAFAAPLPEGVPYSDWWFALCAAQAGEVLYLPEQLALYREHGANLTSSVSGSAGVREHLKEVTFQLWALRHLDIGGLTPAEVKLVWAGVEEHARRALQAAGTAFVTVASVAADGPARAASLIAEAQAARARGDLDGECVLLLRALGQNPFEPELSATLNDAVTRAVALAETPDPLAGVSGFVVLAAVEELLADDSTLTAYAETATRLDDLVLAIDATRMGAEAATAALTTLVERCGLTEREDLEMVAVVDELVPAQRLRLVRRAGALYGRSAAVVEQLPGAERPVLTPATLYELPALVQAQAAR